MKLSIVRSGGFAGILTRTELATESLPPETVHEFHELVADSGLLEVMEEQRNDPTPDDFHYEISIEDEGLARRVRLSEDELPDRVRYLITWLDSVPEREERLEAPGGGRH